MTERNNDIFNPIFWEKRIFTAEKQGNIRNSVYNVPEHMWAETVKHHEEIIKKEIRPSSSVLDAGCGYGRLFELLVDDLHCSYVGIDLTESFIDIAKSRYPSGEFFATNILDFNSPKKFDYAICSSIMIMVVMNKGWMAWEELQNKLLSIADTVICLEYGVGDTKTTSNTYFKIQKV